MLPIDLSGKVAIVTGGSRGIGRATALMLARAGANVVVSYQSRKGDADEVVRQVQQLGARAIAEAGDLSEESAAERLVQRTLDEFGRLDIYVGNAGIWPEKDVAIATMTTEQWRRTLAVNLDAIFFGTRAVAREIAENGRIVLISSTAGQRGEAFHSDYASTKGAIISMVKSLAVELAPRQVTVNSVAPGWVDTEMVAGAVAEGGRDRIQRSIPIGRFASADDIAGPVLFLCSEMARHITGEILNVNGGSVLCG